MKHYWVRGFCWYCHRRRQTKYDISACQSVVRR